MKRITTARFVEDSSRLFLTAIVLAGASSGCRPVTETRRVYDDLAYWQESTTTLPTSHSNSILTTTVLPDGKLRINVSRQPMAVLVKSKSGPRRVVIERETGQRGWGWAGLCLGLILEGFGGWTIVDARNVPLNSDPDVKNPISRKGAYAIGGAIAAIGVPFLVSGAYEISRSRDSVESEGVVTEELSRTDVEAGIPIPVAGQEVSIVVDHETITSLRSDSDGNVILDPSSFPINVVIGDNGKAGVAAVTVGDLSVGEFSLDWVKRWHQQANRHELANPTTRQADTDCGPTSKYSVGVFKHALAKAAQSDFFAAFSELLDYRAQCGANDAVQDSEKKVGTLSAKTMKRRVDIYNCSVRCGYGSLPESVRSRCALIHSESGSGPGALGGACTAARHGCSQRCGCRRTTEYGTCAALDYPFVCPVCGQRDVVKVSTAEIGRAHV